MSIPQRSVLQRRPPLWVLYCALGVSGALATVLNADGPFRISVLGIIAAVSLAGMVFGLIRQRPDKPFVWIAFLFGSALLVTATTFGTSVWPNRPQAATSLFLALQVTGLIILVAGFIAASRIRSAMRDLDSVLDATILGLAFGLFAWRTTFSIAVGDSQIGPAKILTVSVLPAIDILSTTLLMRRAFAAERTSPAFRLILLAAASATFARIVSGVSILNGDVLNNHVPFQIGYLTLLAAAASHPTMRSVTEPDIPMLHKFGATRIALLALALLDPPLVMLMDLGNPNESNTTLLIGATLMSLIVIVRLITLAREMEKTRERERLREARFESLVRNSTDLIAVLDTSWIVTYVSPAVNDLLGFEPRTVLGQDAMSAFHPEDRQHAKDLLTQLSPGDTSDLNLVRVLHRNGTWRWVEARAVNLSTDPIIDGIVINCRDVSERVAAETLLFETNARQSAIAQLGGEALAAPNIESLIQRAAELIKSTLAVSSCQIALSEANETKESIYVRDSDGADEADIPPLLFDVLASTSQPVQVIDHNPSATIDRFHDLQFIPLEDTQVVPHPSRHDAHNRLPAMLAVRLSDRERLNGAVLVRSGFPRSFTRAEADFLNTMAGTLGLAIARRQTEANAHHQALHDTLTALPNRALFVDRLTQTLARIERTKRHVAVMFVDIDHFKVINDSLGHSAGDHILSEVAKRLASIVRPSDTVARFGGDEFTILVDPLSSRDEAIHIAERIRAVVARPIAIGQTEIQPTLSVGLAISQSPGSNPESLLRDADVAMYQAKELGRNQVSVFDDTMRARVMHRLRTEIDLPQGIASNQLTLHYQPVYNLRTRLIEGLEALVRWNHPTLGLLSPDQFIPVAEQSGLIVDLDLWVMHRVMEKGAQWTSHLGKDAPWFGFNVSARTVAGHDLPFYLSQALADTQASPECICIEVTESALMQDIDHSIAVLRALRGQGVALAVDDFGTGYSSLTYLKRLPVTEIKIDASFVSGIGSPGPDRAIAKAVIDLATTLGQRAVAEGVETASQLHILRELNCPLAQGFYLSRPIPERELTLDRLNDIAQYPIVHADRSM